MRAYKIIIMKLRICIAAAILFFPVYLFSQTVTLPTVTALRSNLLQLTASADSRYSTIDGGPVDPSSTDYRVANFHIVAGVRNQLFVSVAADRDNYMEFVSEGINEEQATAGINKWIALFAEAMPEYIFLTQNKSTYGEAFYYYNKEQTNMFTLEVYYSPVKKTWTISLNLYHPTKADKDFIAEKNNSDGGSGDVIAQQKAINQTLTALLKGRVDKFKSFRGIELPGKDGAKMFGVKETSYGFTPGPVEFIDVDAAGATSFHLTAAGFQMPVQIIVCYADLITPALQEEGYSIAKEEGGVKITYTISYKEIPVSVCRLDKTEGVVTLAILGY